MQRMNFMVGHCRVNPGLAADASIRRELTDNMVLRRVIRLVICIAANGPYT